MVTRTEWRSANTWERDAAVGHSMMPGAARAQCTARERWRFWSDWVRPCCMPLFSLTYLTQNHFSAFLCYVVWWQTYSEVLGLPQIKAKWQEYFWGGLGRFCGVVLFCFIFIRLGLFLLILNHIQKCRTLDAYHLYWKFARLLTVTISSHAVAIRGERRTIIAPKYFSKA